MKKMHVQCLKIAQKVAFNIASEASYVYILSGQKFIKSAKNGPFLRLFWKLEACGETVLPDRSILIGQKIGGNVKIKNLKCDIFEDFQTLWRYAWLICHVYFTLENIFSN